MKQYMTTIFWIAVLGCAIYYGYDCISVLYKSAAPDVIANLMKIVLSSFMAGTSVAALTYEIIYSGTSDSLKNYKRELEKKSIDTTENSSRVKVLESKIQVLEKALEEALQK